jgi:glycine/D-amino acid oxidase-like deaminating enzyme
VVGAGAFGGWTALQLLRRGAKVTLVDAWGAGNVRSSSGGESRVIRAIYGADRVYVEMVKRAYELWEALDATTDEPLYVETGALWLHRGDDAYVRSSLPSMKAVGFPVEQLTIAETRRRYPQIDLSGIKSVWLENRAGALSARRACMAVRDAFEKAGGTFLIAHAEPDAITDGVMRSLKSSEALEADVYVFACGPWLGRLFPAVIGDAVQPTRQEVYYFGTPRGSDRYKPGKFPVWIDFGERIFYGIPDTHARGFKIADDTRGEPFDPTNGERTPTEEGIARARRVLAERFPELAKAPLVSSEVCQYENSPDGHLILDRHPEAKNVWLLGGGSGHGFKLSPAVGDMTAEAILAGKEVPKLFGIDRLRDLSKRSTQFDSKKN